MIEVVHSSYSYPAYTGYIDDITILRIRSTPRPLHLMSSNLELSLIVPTDELVNDLLLRTVYLADVFHPFYRRCGRSLC
jgi:hypothetical protein